MRVTIDRQIRDALYDACRSAIEGVSDLKIDDPRQREVVKDLRRRLSLVAPLLDQIGWSEEQDRESFSVDLNVRRVRPFVQRDLEAFHGLLSQSITTVSELRASVEREVAEGWRDLLSDEEWEEELAWMRWRVDRSLDMIAAHARLLALLDGSDPRMDMAAVA